MLGAPRAVLFALLVSVSAPALAQGPPATEPVKEHEWLHQFVGEWEAYMGDSGTGEAAAAPSGTMSSRMLGGLWVVNNLSMDMGGSTMHGIQTIGFDPVRKKYIGTWVDSAMNHMWHYEGTVDESGKRLNLEAKGPDMMGGSEEMVLYRDCYEFQSPDHIVSTAQVMQDGEWVTFMTGSLRRKKQ